MNIIILGAGVVGFQIAQHLINEDKDVVLIEKDPDRAKYVSNHLDCIVLNEEGTSRRTLERAGINKAEFFISVTNSDEVNLIACSIVASEYPGPTRIARVRNLEYSERGVIDRAFFGVDHIVNSEVETARSIFESITHGASGSILTFDNTDLQMRTFTVQKRSFFRDKSLIDMKKSINERFLISSILRGKDLIIPSGNNVLRQNDTVYCMSHKDTFDRVFKKYEGKVSSPIKKMALVGGGRIGTLLSNYLKSTKIDITIIESNYEKCKALAERFPSTLIIHGDISDDEIYNDLQLQNYDLMVTTTSNQEMNIITAAYAHTLGTNNTIALVTKTNYLSIAGSLGISATINPKNSTVDAILKFIRRGNIKSVHSLFEGRAEVIEFTINENSTLSGVMLKDLNFPANALILTVIRQGKDELPDGTFVMREGDTVIAIADKSAISTLEEIFSR